MSKPMIGDIPAILKRHARKHDLAIMLTTGVTLENLDEALAMICEAGLIIGQHASESGGVILDTPSSPRTGIYFILRSRRGYKPARCPNCAKVEQMAQEHGGFGWPDG